MEPKYVKHVGMCGARPHARAEGTIPFQADSENERNPGYGEAFSASPANLLKEKCKMTMAKHLQ